MRGPTRSPTSSAPSATTRSPRTATASDQPRVASPVHTSAPVTTRSAGRLMRHHLREPVGRRASGRRAAVVGTHGRALAARRATRTRALWSCWSWVDTSGRMVPAGSRCRRPTRPGASPCRASARVVSRPHRRTCPDCTSFRLNPNCRIHPSTLRSASPHSAEGCCHDAESCHRDSPVRERARSWQERCTRAVCGTSSTPTRGEARSRRPRPPRHDVARAGSQVPEPDRSCLAGGPWSSPMNASLRPARVSAHLLARLALVLLVAAGLLGFTSAAAEPAQALVSAGTGARAVHLAASRRGRAVPVGRGRSAPLRLLRPDPVGLWPAGKAPATHRRPAVRRHPAHRRVVAPTPATSSSS